MRYAILGDIHSNLEALNAVLWQLKGENIDEYLCIGDVVGYNADPKECIKITKSLCSKIVAGNHDWACVGKLELEWFKDIAKEAIVWTVPLLDDEEKGFLSELELICEYPNFTPLEITKKRINSRSPKGDLSLRGFTLVHGTLFEPEKFHYLINLDYAVKSFRLLKTQLCFIGHTHKPIVYIMDEEGLISCSWDEKFFLNSNLRYIINVGSVGQPRDGDIRACFCIYDTEENSIEIRRVEYDFKKTQEKILAVDLPEKLAFRLSIGG